MAGEDERLTQRLHDADPQQSHSTLFQLRTKARSRDLAGETLPRHAIQKFRIARRDLPPVAERKQTAVESMALTRPERTKGALWSGHRSG